jgi:spore maturation protein CgeB
MRFLVAHPGPAFSVQDVYAGWVESLRNLGQDVFEFNLGDRLQFYATVLLPAGEDVFKHALDADQATELAVNGLYAALMKVRPHVLLVVSAFFVPGQLMDIARSAGVRVVVLHTESPYQDKQQLDVAKHADLNLLNDPLNIDQFREVAAAEYMPHAYRPDLHKPGPVDPDLACDFSFVGTGYPSRVAFLEAMDLTDAYRPLAGNWQALDENSPLLRYVPHDLEECLDNTDTVRLYNSSRASINIYRREVEGGGLSEAGWAMGPRELELAAAGLFFLRDPRPEGDEVLDMLPTFASPEDASEQLRWWLDHDQEREAASEKARAAIADRTFDNHARRLMRLLERE